MAMQVGSKPGEVDVLQWMNRGALELMGQAGLGYSFDPLVSAGSNDLAKAIKALLSVFLPHVYQGTSVD